MLAVYGGGNSLKQRFEYTLGHVPISFTQAGQRYYILTDQVGSPKLITDENGNTVKQLNYDSFGIVISDSNPEFKIPFGFAGGLQDNDTGLIRFGYRDYDPETGRWTARDPIGFAGGDTNLYGYVFNNPISFIDPIGLEVYIFTSESAFEATSSYDGPLSSEVQDVAAWIDEIKHVDAEPNGADIIITPTPILGDIDGDGEDDRGINIEITIELGPYYNDAGSAGELPAELSDEPYGCN